MDPVGDWPAHHQRATPPLPLPLLLHTLGDELRGACRRLGRSDKTAYLYVGWARRFVMFHRNTHPASLGIPQVRTFLMALSRARKQPSSGSGSRSGSGSTQNQALHALRFLYQHVLHMPLDPAQVDTLRAKRAVRLPEPVTRHTIHRFLDRLSGIPRVVASLQLECGLRLNEALALRVSDVQLGEMRLSIRGTDERARDLPIPASLAELLRHFLQLHGSAKLDHDFLFVGERKRRVAGVLRTMPLQAQVIRRAYRAVRPRLSPHLLRQSYAIQQLDQGENVAVVHHRLGQRDFQATLRYASVSKRPSAAVRSPADDHQAGL